MDTVMDTIGLFNIIVAEKEKIKGQGEDAYALSFRNSHDGFIAVYDGCGGMGSKKYASVDDRTGAFIGSRAAALLTDKYYEKNGFEFSGDADKLKSEMTASLKALKDSIDKSDQVQIKSSLFKDLPTTAVIAAMRSTSDGKLACEFIWAGDSRGYILDNKGLCQVTRDDVFTDEDAFTSLRNDAKLKNVVYADGDFTLNSEILRLSSPGMVITATDGAFGYLPTPMHFEFVVLDSLYNAGSVKEWKDTIKEKISAVTGDDFSFIAAVFGFSGLDEIKKYYSSRFNALKRDFIDPCSIADENALEQLWSMYKQNYYRR